MSMILYSWAFLEARAGPLLYIRLVILIYQVKKLDIPSKFENTTRKLFKFTIYFTIRQAHEFFQENCGFYVDHNFLCKICDETDIFPGPDVVRSSDKMR